MPATPATRQHNATPVMPADLQHHLALAVSLHQQGDLVQAETLYKQILDQHPACADAWHLLGVMAHQCNQDPLAIELIGNAISLDRQQAPFYYNLAVALQRHGDLIEAARNYRLALKLQPDNLSALENLGVVEIDLGHLSAAREIFERVVRSAPSSQLGWLNLGTLFNRLNKPQRALECFEEAVRRYPASAEARMKRGSQRLSMDQLSTGWDDFDWRWYSDEFTRQNPPRQLPFPRWDGSLEDDLRLLVVAEQGLGDEVMFATCLPELLQQVGQVVLACDPRLHRLFDATFPGLELRDIHTIEAVDTLDGLGHFDSWLYLGDLPGRFRRSLEQFPRTHQLLQAEPQRVDYWKQRLAQLNANRVIGISWQGGKETRGQQARSLPLLKWRELLQQPGTRFVNLQYGDHRQLIAELNQLLPQPLLDFAEIDPLRELDEFAALIAALDLVITVDNSTAHLAGALGTPTWALLPQPADWRWFGRDDTTPWYPSLRLIRQPDPTPGSWNNLLKQVRKRLSVNTGARETTPADPNPDKLLDKQATK